MKTKQIRLTLLSLLLVVTTSFAGSYKVNSDASSVKWIGKKVSGEHTGAVTIKEGAFTVENGQITGGNFSVDMNSITCTDLKGEWNEKLVGHLKSDDFFGVEKYPVSKLKLTSVKSKSGHSLAFEGSLTIKGKSLPVTFDAHVHASGNEVEASGKIVIDRTKYDIRYGSGKFFDNLGDRMINDEFVLEFNIVALK